MVGKAFALCRVEHREALQERNRLGFFVGLSRALLLVVGYEAVGIDDGRAALALADIAAEGQSLVERAPALAGEAVLDDGAPEDEHVHARIAAPGGGVFRHSERRLRRCCAPGLDPGHAPGLQLGDDLGGDFVVKARPVGAGTGWSSLSGHRGSPRRAPGASLPAVNPSRKPRLHSCSRLDWLRADRPGRGPASRRQGSKPAGPRPRISRAWSTRARPSGSAARGAPASPLDPASGAQRADPQPLCQRGQVSFRAGAQQSSTRTSSGSTHNASRRWRFCKSLPARWDPDLGSLTEGRGGPALLTAANLQAFAGEGDNWCGTGAFPLVGFA